jgi:hypothetical protein
MAEDMGESNMRERKGTKMRKREYERKENGQNMVIKRSISEKKKRNYIYAKEECNRNGKRRKRCGD